MASERRPKALMPRKADLNALFDAVHEMHCLSVVAVSNVGKSALLRAMTDPQMQAAHLGDQAGQYVFVYVDFNQMLEMTEQAFYELVLRCLLDVLHRGGAHDEVARQVEAAYTGIVAPASSFEIPLRFAQAMAAIGDSLPQQVVFLFDEIDEPLSQIAGRVFLNLRALKDRHGKGLTYITATNRRLGQICAGTEDGHTAANGDVAEFAELFGHRTHHMTLLSDAESIAFAQMFAAEEGVTFSEQDLAFIHDWAGGHPGLLEGTCRVLGIVTGRPIRDASQNLIIHRRAVEILAQDINLQAECRKLWVDLCAEEQAALIALLDSDEQKYLPGVASVMAKHLVVGEGPERRLFGRAFADFVQRQRAARRTVRDGLRVDPETGEVWVNGQQIPTLTNLEYRLLLLLYGHLGKICSKYEVVEAVWGESYIDEVDDARIEKLVSRLRQKIEPDAANPRYLVTVRGRGYKLLET